MNLGKQSPYWQDRMWLQEASLECQNGLYQARRLPNLTPKKKISLVTLDFLLGFSLYSCEMMMNWVLTGCWIERLHNRMWFRNSNNNNNTSGFTCKFSLFQNQVHRAVCIDTEHLGQRQQEIVGGTHHVGSFQDISVSIVIFNKVISNYNALKKLKFLQSCINCA